MKQKQFPVNESEVPNLVPLHRLEIRVFSISEEFPKRSSIIITIEIEGKSVVVEFYTGGTVSVMNLTKFKDISI